MTHEIKLSSSLSILILTDALSSGLLLENQLRALGHRPIKYLLKSQNFKRVIQSCESDIIFFQCNNFEDDNRDRLKQLIEHCEIPVLVLTDCNDVKHMEYAIRTGVSAYVVGEVKTNRIASVIYAACLRFKQFQELKKALAITQKRLSARKTIEKAKGLVMSFESLTEAKAYRYMRTMAMSNNCNLADISMRIIEFYKGAKAKNVE